MTNPRAIKIHCDGAMDYDRKQTGGNGFIIEFPDFFELEPITGSIRNDKQGIHRLEMISLIEAMEELLFFGKKNPMLLQKAEAVELFTDRMRVTDDYLTNPYSIRAWRRAGWKNHEGKAIKDADLLDKIDKTRVKVGQAVRGGVSISWIPERRNRAADKLSKTGKLTETRGRKLIEKKRRYITRRLFDGPIIKYPQLTPNDTLEARLYAWELVGKQYEVCFEIYSGKFREQIVKVYVDEKQKAVIHRGHYYKIIINEIFRYHITASSFREIELVK